MKKELKNFIIKYTEKDLDYIDYIVDECEKRSDSILEFLGLESVPFKIEVEIYSTLDEFLDYYVEHTNYEKKEDVPSWLVGVCFGGKCIKTLCYEEYHKRHPKEELDALPDLFLHEFTHAASMMASPEEYGKHFYPYWFLEGIATYLSDQFKHREEKSNKSLEFKVSYDDIVKRGNLYPQYYLFFKYVVETYGRDYIINLLNDYELIMSETPKLYEEVVEHYKQKSL